MPAMLSVLDPTQLRRIEALHRGFLYQHVYGVGCLLLATAAGASAVVVEADEDIEIVYPCRRLYVQVKTRSESLTEADIEGALQRFARIREEHITGKRPGAAAFAIVANVLPGPKLAERVEGMAWPTDITLYWPGNEPTDDALPAAWVDVAAGIAACTALAATLPFGSLVPETLVWKLGCLVMSAAAAIPPRGAHAFQIDELPNLFEQMVIQLQDFPAPPVRYRSQAAEPDLISDARVRVITGFSGAGKTMWVAQAAQHSTAALAYFDVGDTPGPAIALPLARELAGRFFRKGGSLGQILLPGATGTEMLRAIGLRLQSEKINAIIVIDNAHRVPTENLRTIVQQIPHVHFILLAQPGPVLQEFQATLALTPEPLGGWTTDTIAAEVTDNGCRADFATCERLRALTGGLPLYVQNSVQITAADYVGELVRFCDELEARTHNVATVQEIILARVFEGLAPQSRDTVAILSLSDIPLERTEAAAVLAQTNGLDDRSFAQTMRQLRSAGVVEVFGGDRLKIHDAMRVLGRMHLDSLKPDVLRVAQSALKDVLVVSISQERDIAKLSLYLRLLADLGDIRTLVEFATDEIFHEMGLIEQISGMLETAAASKNTAPAQRFSAFDGLAFREFKRGDIPKVEAQLDAMRRLIGEHNLGDEDRLTLAMKSMNLAARLGDVDGVFAEIETTAKLLPEKPGHLRIFRYNAAHALGDLGQYEVCASITKELITEYYEVLDLTPDNVMGNNPDRIWPLLKKEGDHTDDLKHLADCLDLWAYALNKMGKHARLARIHAMKFYSMANALDSFVRVGQDLVDEFVARNDYIGARDVLERNVLPTVIEHKMVSRMVPVRSHYAVVLAYCGDHQAADTVMANLAPYEAGLSPEGRGELQEQRRIIAKLRRVPPPPQWEFSAPRRKLGRNERCYCGSGKKFKFCHGANS
ncbi:MAG: hypothetical protein GC191_20955 [Azospirillum sp.]|nr:hypothetical protein [Azospirillum sp.]